MRKLTMASPPSRERRRPWSSRAAAAVFGVTLAVGLVGCSQPAPEGEVEVIEIDVAHNQAATHPQHVVLEQVAERVAENTDGSVVLNVFPSAQLGTNADLIDQFQAGGDVITVHNMAEAAEAGSVPSLAAVSAMYAFTGPNGQTGPEAVWPVIQEFLASDMMAGWTDELAENNFVMLAANWYLGERNIISDREEGHPTPEDLAGLTIRIPGGSTWQAYFGETPVTTATIVGSEVYTAMQQGTVNAAEGPYAQMLGWSLQELGKSITLTGHGNDSQGFSTGTETWNKLSPEQQEALKEAFEWGGNEFSELTVANAETDRETMEAAGLNFVEADVDAYRDVATDAYGPANFPDWDEGVLEAIREASGQ